MSHYYPLKKSITTKTRILATWTNFCKRPTYILIRRGDFRLASALFAQSDQSFEFVHELGDVLKFQVDGGEADIGDLIKVFQAAHDHLADFRCRAFALRRSLHEGFDCIDYSFELGGRDGAFLAGAKQSRHDFVAVERFAPAIFLDDHVWDFVDPLVGGESPLAFQALAAAAYRIALPRFAGIDDPIFDVSAEWALHKIIPPLAFKTERATGPQSHREENKRRRGKKNLLFSLSLCLLVSLSPCLPLSGSVALWLCGCVESFCSVSLAIISRNCLRLMSSRMR